MGIYKRRYNNIITTCFSIILFILFIILFVFVIINYNALSINLRIITYNIEYGAERYSAKIVADIVNKYYADVLLIQEAYTENKTDTSIEISKILGWNRISSNISETAILTKYEIIYYEEHNHFLYSKIDKYDIISVHLDDWYYQPFQASYIPYERDGVHEPYTNNTEELIKYATDARGKDIDEIIFLIKDKENVIMGGDFNEPSYKDWTNRATEKGYCPLAVEYPSIQKLEEKGMKDVYRNVYTDEIIDRGLTWPAYKVDYEYRDDRIDYIVVTNTLEIEEINVLQYDYSDHRPIVVSIKM